MLIDPNQFASGASSGEMAGEAVAELQKALTAGYGSDPAGFTGGAALRIQSLDRTMYTTVQENDHFKLFNRLAKPSAGATVDEWTEQNSIGGFLGGSTNSETGNIVDATGNYARRVGMVKFLMTRRQLRGALRRVIQANLGIFDRAGMVQIEFSQNDTEEFMENNTPLYYTRGMLNFVWPTFVQDSYPAVQDVSLTVQALDPAP